MSGGEAKEDSLVLPLKDSCVQYEGSKIASEILKDIKLACVAYEPSKVLYEGDIKLRKDLLIEREKLIK